MPTLSFLSRRQELLLPILVTLFSFLCFQLALFAPINALIFAGHGEATLPSPSQFEGILAIILGKAFTKLAGAKLGIRILTALLSGLSAYCIHKLLGSAKGAIVVLASIGFLFFASHSPYGMLTLLWGAVVYLSFSRRSYQAAGVLCGFGYGVDQFLSVGLSLFLIVQAFRTETKVGLKTMLAVAIGTCAIACLAYMLYGSNGFATAMSVGSSGLFSKVNPLIFGLSALITFNVLVPFFLRTHEGQGKPDHLGSWLIVPFLFIKAEPIYLLILLLVGVYWISRSGLLERRRWLTPAFAAVNVAAFFVLPAITPMAARYQPRIEQSSEATIFLNEYFSRWMPSLSSLLSREEALRVATKLTEPLGDSVIVIADPMTDVYFDLSALETNSLRYSADENALLNKRGDQVSLGDALAKGEVYYLSTGTAEQIERVFGGHQAGDSLQLHRIDAINRKRFFDAYIFSYYRSFH
jgi:hypothetical protein